MTTLQRNKNKISNIYITVSKNIKKYRELKNMTQQELANKSGYSYAYIRRIEAPSCTKNFSIQTIYIISIALEIPIKYLFDDKDI